MAYLLAGGRPAAAASSHPFAPVLRWLAAGREARRRRIALAELMELDHWLLDDLGITRNDVIDAFGRPDTGAALAARRAARAKFWSGT